jgi:CubicO group peptidase (beta-lactamase class C family)
MKNNLHFLFIVLILVAAGACTSTPQVASPIEPAMFPTANWETSTPEDQGMDSQILVEMLETIITRGYEIDSVVIIRNGYLVLEAYKSPFEKGNRHIVYSCTKSVISALVGIAIDQGYIESVDIPLNELFSKRNIANLDEDKRAITLENVLTMSSGFDCQDSYLYNWQGLYQMRASDDWTQFVLDLPMAYEPGTHFEYCNGGSHLLSAIIQEKTGVTALTFAHKNLFTPLGINDVYWETNSQGVSIGYSQLYLTPLDMAKIGYLYLNNGAWDGKQVISAEWVQASTKEHIAAGTLQDSYGYQWWIDASGVYLALGYRGQFIFVVPDKNLVVVFASQLEGNDFNIPETFLHSIIIPAVKADSPIELNADGLATLQRYTNRLAGY